MRWSTGAAAVAGALAGVAQLVAPTACVGCSRPGVDLCAGCRREVTGPARRTRPDPCPPGFPVTATVAAYDGAVGAAVVALKERGRTGLTAPLGDALGAAVALVLVDDGWPGPVHLVPVPSSPQARRARDTDAVDDLARRAARRLRSAGVEAAVARRLRSARRADQAGLSAAARAVNLAGSMRASAARPGTPVVVVDDVVTTGATLVEAARALTASGALVLGAATVAATARRGPRVAVGDGG